jgi:hypothetical protein
MDKFDFEQANKLAQILRNLEVSGRAMDVGKAGTMYSGRLGYNFPLDDQSRLGLGVGGMGFADNRYNIPSVINSLDLSYGTPNQQVTLGYYPHRNQFLGQPMGQGGVSLMYRRQFD